MSRNSMLHEFLTSNRDELIARCKTKVAKRSHFIPAPVATNAGIPLFLTQLADTLRLEEASPLLATAAASQATPASMDIGRGAALHGTALLRLGYTVDQVVHDYGDVCQAITELAIERTLPMGTEEFRTLNRCLDNAIADAVTAFARGSEASRDSQEEIRHERVNAFSDEHRRLLDIARQSFSAIKTGNIGATGATGGLLMHALDELSALAEQVRP